MQARRWVLFFILLLTPFFVKAETEERVKVAEDIKYFKTTTVLSNSEVMRAGNLGEVSSLTTEITEEEYNSVDTSTANTNSSRGLISHEIETTYKRLATTMYSGSIYFTYVTTLNWKLIPSTRSYDIIGIGHYATVQIDGNVRFDQNYCRSANDCYNSTSYYGPTFVNGAAAMFKVPSGTLTSLEQIIEIDVEKAVDYTIYEQIAVGDYSHATSSISYSNAQNFHIDCGGVRLDSSIEDYYDDIGETTATWTGSW